MKCPKCETITPHKTCKCSTQTKPFSIVEKFSKPEAEQEEKISVFAVQAELRPSEMQ